MKIEKLQIDWILKNPIIIFCISFLIFTSIYYNRIPLIFGWHVPDSDDVTRILQVRAWLNGQGFYDLVLKNVNPPIGADMHWSRLADIPLASLQLFLRLFMNNDLAEKYAVFFTPLVLASIFVLVAGNFINKLSPTRFCYIIAIMMVVAIGGVNYSFSAGRVDHHGLQLIFFVSTLNFIANKSRWGGFWGGIFIALSLTVGFELIPPLGLIIALVALAWGIKPETYKELNIGLGIGLIIGCLFGLAFNNAPSTYFKTYNDELSMAQIIPIISASILLIILVIKFSDRPLIFRISALSIIAIITIAIAYQFPVLHKKLYWQISPIFYKLWFRDIGETFPIYHFPKYMMVGLGTFIIISSFISIFMTIKNKENKDLWILVTSLLCGLTLMVCFFQIRVSGQANTVAILVFGAFISQFINRKNFIIGVIALAFLGATWGQTFSNFVRSKENLKGRKMSFGTNPGCYDERNFSHLAKEPFGLVLTNINSGSATIINAHKDVITTSFHRDLGRETTYKILLSEPKTAYELMKKRGINYVAYCARSMEIVRISEYAPNSLMATLKKRQIPDFLEELPKPERSDIYAFKVK